MGLHQEADSAVVCGGIGAAAATAWPSTPGRQKSNSSNESEGIAGDRWVTGVSCRALPPITQDATLGLGRITEISVPSFIYFLNIFLLLFFIFMMIFEERASNVPPPPFF